MHASINQLIYQLLLNYLENNWKYLKKRAAREFILYKAEISVNVSYAMRLLTIKKEWKNRIISPVSPPWSLRCLLFASEGSYGATGYFV